MFFYINNYKPIESAATLVSFRQVCYIKLTLMENIYRQIVMTCIIVNV